MKAARTISRFVALAIPSLLFASAQVLPPSVKPPQPVSDAQSIKHDPLGRDSPLGCAAGFLKAAGRGDYGLAARYLDTQVSSTQAQKLARELKVVLDLGLTSNIEKLPRTVDGDLEGGLPPTRQHVGSIKTKIGALDVVLSRVARGSGPPVWLFSPETIQGVPEAFGDLGSSNPSRFFPKSLNRIEFLSLPLWRWFTISIGIGLALVCSFLLTRAWMPLLGLLIQRITQERDERRLASLKAPIAVIQLAVAVRVIGLFGVSLLARETWKDIAMALAVIGVAWLAVRFSDIVSILSTRQLVRRQASDKIGLLAFTRRLFKILVVLVAIILLLRGAGVNVTAMLAGLGIGGVALALAAQKTLENFFGGIAIIMREVVRVGDFCKIADQVGTVEDVGFSATRVRTLDRTVVSVSNAQAVQTSIENYSLRDTFWFHHTFGLRYDTSAGQVRNVLTGIGDMLRSHPKLESESARIRLIGFGHSSLDVEVFAYVRVEDYVRFLEAQEQLLLNIMDIVAANGTHLALPSQLTYIDRDKPEKPSRDGGEEPSNQQPHLQAAQRSS